MKDIIRMSRLLGIAVMTFVMVFGLSATSHAIVLFEQTPDASLQGSFSNSGAQVTADQFALAGDSSITDVHWYGYYGADLDPARTSADFQLRFYDEGSGLPDSLLYDATVAASIADTGLVLSSGPNAGQKIYLFTADPIEAFLAMGSQTYWLAISENDSSTPGQGDTQWLWHRSNNFATASARLDETSPTNDWNIGGGNFAFYLTGTTGPVIPEPTTMLLFGSGLFGAVFSRKRW